MNKLLILSTKAFPNGAGMLVSALAAFGIKSSPAEFLAGVVLGMFGNVAIQSVLDKENRASYLTIVTAFFFVVIGMASFHSNSSFLGIDEFHPAIVIGLAGAFSTLIVEKAPDVFRLFFEKLSKGGKK